MTLSILILFVVNIWLLSRINRLEIQLRSYEYVMSRIETTLNGFNERTK